MAGPVMTEEEQAQARSSGMPDNKIIDQWTFFDYKGTFYRNSPTWMAPSWTDAHYRRLQAYRLLEDYYRNSARRWLSSDVEFGDRQDRRELGDPYVIVEQYLSSLLGDDQSIVVPEAAKANASPGAKTFLQKMLKWAEDELLDIKVVEMERGAVKLGDGTYVLSWDTRLNRPICEVWDAGFYFPVLDHSSPTSQYPKKIHMAYEYQERDASGTLRSYVRRKTWSLELVADPVQLPWNNNPTDELCFYEEREWLPDDIKQVREDLDWSGGTEIVAKTVFAINNTPLDFIPVIHIPNTISLQEHYGVSVLSPVVQVLDELVSNDTDNSGTSTMVGSPPVALSGWTAPKDDKGRMLTYGPGTVWETGDGSATVVDTSHSLDALMKYNDALLSRLSVNARIPEALLGRVKPNEVPSGIALSLSFSPHNAMIKAMRKVRRRKYSLLFKFAGRMMWAANQLDSIFDVEYHFGSYLPSDRSQAIDLVVQGMSSKPPVLSLETAVRILVEAGFPIEDAQAEVDNIRTHDYAGADALLNATGDLNAVRAVLKLAPTLTPQPPTLGGPPAPTGAPTVQ